MSDKRNFRQMLEERNAEGKFLCVGLDPVKSRIEPLWEGRPQPMIPTMRIRFLTEIVRATASFAAAYKPNWSFFLDDNGETDLKCLIKIIRQEAPGVPIILDWKTGDIGASNEGYIAKGIDLEVDAMTVHSYLGVGTWTKALEQGLGLLFLCRTSNDEAAALQDKRILVPNSEIEELTGLSLSESKKKYDWLSPRFDPEVRMPVYEYVALQVAALKNQNCGLVVGATAPEQLARVRLIAPDTSILIPGVGKKQGGKIENVVPVAGDDFLINLSSDVLYAFEESGDGFAEAAHLKAKERHDQIISIREEAHA